MLTEDDMTPELYEALKHSGIDPDDSDFLAHYGVPGMKWGQRRREDRAERRAGGGRITPLVSFKGKPVVSLVRRTSPLQQGINDTKKAVDHIKAMSPAEKKKLLRQQMINVGIGATILGAAATAGILARRKSLSIKNLRGPSNLKIIESGNALINRLMSKNIDEAAGASGDFIKNMNKLTANQTLVNRALMPKRDLGKAVEILRDFKL